MVEFSLAGFNLWLFIVVILGIAMFAMHRVLKFLDKVREDKKHKELEQLEYKP